MKHQDTLANEHWQAVSEEKIFSELMTSEKGLTQEEVKKRLEFYGSNRLPEGKKVTLIQIILHQLLNPLIFILVAAAAASVAIGEGKEQRIFVVSY